MANPTGPVVTTTLWDILLALQHVGASEKETQAVLRLMLAEGRLALPRTLAGSMLRGLK